MKQHKFKRTDRQVKRWLEQTPDNIDFYLSSTFNQTLTKEMKRLISFELKRFYTLGKSVGHGGRW